MNDFFEETDPKKRQDLLYILQLNSLDSGFYFFNKKYSSSSNRNNEKINDPIKYFDNSLNQERNYLD